MSEKTYLSKNTSSSCPTTSERRKNTHTNKNKEIALHQRINYTRLLEKLVENPTFVNINQIKDILGKFLSRQDIKLLEKGYKSAILQKYKAVIHRKYVQAIAAVDVLNYCSASPTAISRSDDIRLETMEQLRKRVEKKLLSKEKFQQIHQTFFPDILSKDTLPDTQITKILRCMANGKFYAPVTANGQLDEKALSPAYISFRQKKQTQASTTFSDEDYDFFGISDSGKPLCPVFYAVNDSENFHQMSKSIAQRMGQLGIPPSVAYQFNAADIALIMQKDKELRDIPFAEISPNVTDSPYQEFAHKFGLILKIGSRMNHNHKQITKLWLDEFATSEQKTDYEDYGFKDGLTLFISEAEKTYDKLSKDFAEKGIAPDFLDAWAESLYHNKSFNPNLAQCRSQKPYKIEIHHWERLSAAADDAVAANKNNLDNFGVMIKYTKDDFDIHAFLHEGESANYVTADFEKKQQQKASHKNTVCTSNFLYLSADIFWGRKDCTKGLKKINDLRNKKKLDSPQKQDNKSAPSYTARKAMTKDMGRL